MDKLRHRHIRVAQWMVLAGVVGLSWAFAFGRSMPMFIPWILIAAIGLIIRWKTWGALVLLAFSPMGILFFTGAAEWFETRPQFRGMGLPHAEAGFNLDPKTRCYRSTGGCVIRGGEWVWNDSHNAGLWLMTKVLGHPPKTYRGPYPTKEEARFATEKAAITPLRDLEEGVIKLGDRRVVIGKQQAEHLLADLGIHYLQGSEDVDSSLYVQLARVAVWRDQCLIVRVTQGDRTGLDDSWSNRDGVYLFDLSTERPFARYAFHEHIPRIPWLLTRDW